MESEGNSKITVVVEALNSYESTVTLMIIPLTVDEALLNGVITSFDPLDTFSPNRAGQCTVRSIKSIELTQ